jgi:hypothetical protein
MSEYLVRDRPGTAKNDLELSPVKCHRIATNACDFGGNRHKGVRPKLEETGLWSRNPGYGDRRPWGQEKRPATLVLSPLGGVAFLVPWMEPAAAVMGTESPSASTTVYAKGSLFFFFFFWWDWGFNWGPLAW